MEMDLLTEGEATGAVPVQPAPTSADPSSRYRDTLRLLFIMVAGSEAAEPPTEEVAKIFRAEKRLMAMDFLVRYPDYLADALLDILDAEPDPDLLERIQSIFQSDEPSVRLVKMVRWKRGAYENIEDALSLLSYYGLVQPMQLKAEDGKIRRYEYLIAKKASVFLDQCVTEHPELGWYRDRMQLVMRVAAGKSGSALKEWQYEHPSYSNTLHGDLIPSIRAHVEQRLAKYLEA